MSKHPDTKLTLRQAFDAYKRDDLDNPGTIGGYETTLKVWESCTSNPAVGDVTDRTLARFRETLKSDFDYRPATVNRHLVCVLSIFHRIGPRQSGFPGAAGVLDWIPHVKKLRVELKRPRVMSLDDIGYWFQAADAAEWPNGIVEPAAWWRAAIVFLYVTACRRSDWLRLRWDDIDFDDRVIRFTAGKTGKPHAIPLHPVLECHLHRIRSNSPKVFPCGRSPRVLNRERMRTQSAGGIDPPFTFHDVRRTSATQYNRVDEGIAPVISGHAPRGAMARHYIDPSDRVREAVAKLPIPDSFRWETGQLDLFDDEKREERERKRRTEKPASDWRFGQSHAVFRGHAVELRPANNAKQWNGTGRKRNVRLTLLQTLVEAAGPVSYQTLREKVWDGKPVKLSTIKETVYQLNRILRRNFNWPKSACPISTARIGQSWTGLMFELPAGAPLPAWK